MKLHAHGLQIDLPGGWSGRVFSRAAEAATLHAASYVLALKDGEFGDASTAMMPPGSCFFSLTEYLIGDDLQPGTGLFRAKGIVLPLDPMQFSPRGLAHPRPGQVGMQRFFTQAGRPFCLYVVLAGERQVRRRGLAHVDHVLGTLRISGR